MVKKLYYCPKCGTDNPETKILKEPDFDEEGWFWRVKHDCRLTTCKNTWFTKEALRTSV